MADVNTPVDAYAAMQAKWALSDALRGGTAQMRAAKKAYLPQETGETNEAYEQRLSRTFLYPAYSKALEYASAKPFTQPITFSEDFNAKLLEYTEDIDLQGNDINVFAHDAFLSACHRGLTHILIDYPLIQREDGQQLTLADVREQGARPYLVHLPAEDVIGWQPRRDFNGRISVGQFRYRRIELVADGDFGTKLAVRVYVHTPGQVQIWEKQGDQMVLLGTSNTGLDYIPVVTFYTNRTGFMTGAPLFEELAYKNLEHWQSSSDQNNILHKARVPILFMKGMDSNQPAIRGREQTKIEIGPNSLVRGGVDSDLKYVEHTGAAIDAGRTALEDIKREMSQLAYEIMVGQGGDIKATERAIEQSQNNTVLTNLALRFQDTLEQAFSIMADYDGITDDVGSVSVFTDFSVGLFDNSDMNTLIEMKKLNVISDITLINEAKRRNILSENIDAKDEAELTNTGVDYSNSSFVNDTGQN